MKIQSVEAYWVHIPIPPEKQHTSDFGRMTSFDATLVRRLVQSAADMRCARHLLRGRGKRFCRLVEVCNLTWFEEPVTADDKAGRAQVRATTDIPIAAGESEFTRHDFRDLAMLGAVDIFQPDLAICDGITEAMRISALPAPITSSSRRISGPVLQPLPPVCMSRPRRLPGSSSNICWAPARSCTIWWKNRSRCRMG
jgi:hypothetical protein